MGRRRAYVRPRWPSGRDPRLRLVIADRGEHEAAVLRRAAHRADQLAAGSGTRGDRCRTAAVMTMTELGIKEQLQILLEEYNTLRAELIQRTSWQMQMATVTGSAIVVTSGFVISGNVIGGVLLLCLAAIALTFGVFAIHRDTRMIAKHMQDLEEKINDLAGKRLLTWERDHGILAVGLLERFRRTLAGDSN